MSLKKSTSPMLVSLDRIWNRSPHCALTDLIFWNHHYWCVFRESDSHVGGQNGFLTLLQSSNGIIWDINNEFECEGWDLRDPKLSITPSGQLMLLAGASQYNSSKERMAQHSLVCFSSDGKNWSSFKKILYNERWLWRLTWFQGIGYGVAYFFSDPKDRNSEWYTELYQTTNGIDYQKITSFSIPGKPNETTLRFLSTGQMIALVRREEPNDHCAWIGTSFPPYEDWLWSETNIFLGGPNFIILPNDQMWAAGRVTQPTPYGKLEKTALISMNFNHLEPKLILPSSGDSSYPGLLYQEPYIWMSYYASQEGSTGIYLAKISI